MLPPFCGGQKNNDTVYSEAMDCYFESNSIFHPGKPTFSKLVASMMQGPKEEKLCVPRGHGHGWFTFVCTQPMCQYA